MQPPPFPFASVPAHPSAAGTTYGLGPLQAVQRDFEHRNPAAAYLVDPPEGYNNLHEHLVLTHRLILLLGRQGDTNRRWLDWRLVEQEFFPTILIVEVGHTHYNLAPERLRLENV